ncbi:MAG: YncE family protein [Deltaproteobacteria bacterium]
MYQKLQNINDSIEFSKTKPYNITELGLEFHYPSNWKIEEGNEGNLFNSTKFFIPTIYGNSQLIIRPFSSSSMTDLSSMISNIERADIYYGNWTVINSSQMNLKSKEGYFLDMFKQHTDERYVTFNFVHNKIAISIQLYIQNILFPEYKQMFYDFLNTIKFHEKEIEVNPTFNIGERPTRFEIDKNRNVAYVPHLNSRSLSVFDIKQNKIIENITVGIKPSDVAFESFDNLIYVANIGSDNVSVIESATRKVITEIPVGKMPAKLAVDSDEMERLIFVSNTNSSSITPISGQSLRAFPEISW